MAGGKEDGEALAGPQACCRRPASGYLGSRGSCRSAVKCPDEAPALTRLLHGEQRHLGKGGATRPGRTSASQPELCLPRLRMSSGRPLADVTVRFGFLLLQSRCGLQ